MSVNHDRTSYSEPRGERRDCSVRAYSVVACVSYDEAHALFERHGRKSNRGTPYKVTKEVMAEQFPQAKWSRSGITLGRFIESHPKGHYLIHVRGHALAVCDGTLHDWFPKPRRRVKWYWEVA